MLDFGEELTVEIYKIPWLIWIQILVLLLLMILLYCISVFSLDLSPDDNNNSIASASSGSCSSSISRESHLDKNPVALKRNSTVTHRPQPFQVGEIQIIKGEIATSTGRRILREGEEITETDSNSSSIYYHPCYYFRIAREAFLKCLGLGMEPVPNKSLNQEQKKDR